MDKLAKRAGSRQVFAIEFEINPGQNGPVNEWWGNLWLWVNGKCIGNPDETEMVSVGLGSLVNSAQKTGARVSPLLSSLPPDKALDCVMWAVYGDEDPTFQALIASRESLYPFEILQLLIRFSLTGRQSLSKKTM